MLEIKRVNYDDHAQMDALIQLLNGYACDPMGGGEPLNTESIQRLPEALKDCPTALSLIAYVDEQPAGLLNAFWSVSTFAAKRLINIHDIAVSPNFRGRGVATALLAEIESIARELGCCKLTLEVLSGNQPAQRTYQKSGFAGYELDPAAGQALFWQKKL